MNLSLTQEINKNLEKFVLESEFVAYNEIRIKKDEVQVKERQDILNDIKESKKLIIELSNNMMPKDMIEERIKRLD